MNSNTPKNKLKVALMTSYDPIFMHQFLEKFLSKAPSQHDFKVYFVENKRQDATFLAKLKKILYLFSWRGFFLFSIKWLSSPWLKHKIKEVAQSKDVQIRKVGDINASSFQKKLSEWGPDLIFSVSCPQILSEGSLSLPHLGCINIHNGKLPDYRGLFSTFWQMYNKEPSLKITAHEMTSKIDKGKIIKTLCIHYNYQKDNLYNLIIKAKRKDAKILFSTLEEITKKEKIPIQSKMSAKKEKYYKFPNLSDIKKFKQKGLKTI